MNRRLTVLAALLLALAVGLAAPVRTAAIQLLVRVRDAFVVVFVDAANFVAGCF
ncbi:MAG: hypothetical protein ACFCUO_04850 [Rhodospirillales bacterium]